MYKPLNQAPLEFMERYNGIVGDKEKVGTVAQLKAFWLFAVEQGWKSHAMRGYISQLAWRAAYETSLRDAILHNKLDPSVSVAYYDFMKNEFIGASSDPSAETDEEYADRVWHEQENIVKSIPEEG